MSTSNEDRISQIMDEIIGLERRKTSGVCKICGSGNLKLVEEIEGRKWVICEECGQTQWAE